MPGQTELEFIFSAPWAALVVGADGRIRLANDPAHDLFGYPHGTLLGRPVEDLVPSELREAHAGHRARFTHEPSGRRMGATRAVRGLHHDGRRLALQVGLGPATWDGAPAILVTAAPVGTGHGGTGADRILSTSGDGVLVVGDDGAILFSNPVARRWLRELDPADRQILLALASPESQRLHIGPEHAASTVAASARAIEWEGSPATLVGLRDVTSEERRQDQQLTAEKLRLVGQLAATASHDVNNLLMTVRAAVELALHEEQPALREEHLRTALTAVGRGRDLTTRLLFLGRRAIRNTERVDLGSVLDELRPLLDKLVPRDLPLHLSVAGGALVVDADRRLLEQVVVNLVTNARDACLERGAGSEGVGVEVRRVAPGDPVFGDARAEPDGDGARIVLKVSDRGVGMTPSRLEQIFDPFFTTKEPGRGTGLGLAGVDEAVSRSGGRVVVDSEPGVGSTFWVVLPESTTQTIPPLEEVLGEAPPRILVVDDERPIRELVGTHLRRIGCEVFLAASGTEALHLAQGAGHLDLLLTDLVMPEVDGWSLARALQERQPDLQVLMMTGYGHDVLRSHGVDPAGVRVLTKPFGLARLTERVGELIALPARPADAQRGGITKTPQSDPA